MSDDKRQLPPAAPPSVVTLVPKGSDVDAAVADLKRNMAAILELEALLAKKAGEKLFQLMANGFTRAEAIEIIKAEK